MRVPIAWKPSGNDPVNLALIEILPNEVVWPILPDKIPRCFPTDKPKDLWVTSKSRLASRQYLENFPDYEMSRLLKLAQVTQARSIIEVYDWGNKTGLNKLYPANEDYPFNLGEFQGPEGLRRLIDDHLVIVKLEKSSKSVQHLFCVRVDESGDYIHLPRNLNKILRTHFLTHSNEPASQAAIKSGLKELNSGQYEKILVTGNPPVSFVNYFLSTHNGQAAPNNFAVQGPACNVNGQPGTSDQGGQGGQSGQAGPSNLAPELNPAPIPAPNPPALIPAPNSPAPIPAPNPQPPVPAAPPCPGENRTHGKQWARLDSTVAVNNAVSLQCVNIGGMIKPPGGMSNLPYFANVRGNLPNSPNPPNDVMHRYSQLAKDETLHKVAEKIHVQDSALVKFFAVRHDMILGSHGREDELLINPWLRSSSGRNTTYKRLESIAFELPHEMTRRDIINWWKSNDVYERLNALLITGHGLRVVEAHMTPLTGAPEQALKRMLQTSDEFKKHALTVFNGIEYNRRVCYADRVPPFDALQIPSLRLNEPWDADENSAYNHTIYDVHNLVRWVDRKTPTTIFRADESINWIKAGGRPYNETEETMESLLRYVRDNIETDIGKCDDLVILYGIYPPEASLSVTTSAEDDIPRVLRWSDTLINDAMDIDDVKFTLTEEVDEISQERDFAAWVRKSAEDDGIVRMAKRRLPTKFPVLAPRNDRDTKNGIYGWEEMARRILAQRIIDTQVQIFEQLIPPIFNPPTPDEIREEVVRVLHSGTQPVLFHLDNISGNEFSIWNTPSKSGGQIAVHFAMEWLRTAYPLLDDAEELIKHHFLEPLYVWIRRLDGWLFESQLTLDLIVYDESQLPSSATLRRRMWRQQVMPEYIGYSSSSDLETKIKGSSMFNRQDYPRQLPYNIAYCNPLPKRVNMNEMKINPFLDMGEVELLQSPKVLQIVQLVWANKTSSQNLVKPKTSVSFLQTLLGVKEFTHQAVYALPYQEPIQFDKTPGMNAVTKVENKAVYGANGQPKAWVSKSIVRCIVNSPTAPAVGEAGPSGVDPTATNATNAATVTAPLSSSKAREASVEQLRKRIMSLGLAAERLPDKTRTLLQV
jgi:hypothetical protein